LPKLYSFGCSFTSLKWKNWCVSKHGYPEYELYTETLSNKLGLELIDSSYEARGNNSILLDFASTKFEDNSVIILQLTGFSRYEFINFHSKIKENETWYLDKNIIGPITSASIRFGEGGDRFFSLEDTKTYFDFVLSFEKLFLINDLYNATKLISKFEKEYPTCKFILTTIENVENPIFNVVEDFYEKRRDIIDRIDYNGFYEYNIDLTWEKYCEEHGIENDFMKTDKHLNQLGNTIVYEKILSKLEGYASL
jgi:hypothetical protein